MSRWGNRFLVLPTLPYFQTPFPYIMAFFTLKKNPCVSGINNIGGMYYLLGLKYTFFEFDLLRFCLEVQFIWGNKFIFLYCNDFKLLVSMRASWNEFWSILFFLYFLEYLKTDIVSSLNFVRIYWLSHVDLEISFPVSIY